MKLDYPHIIKEGPVRYELGQPNGDYIIYDFNKIITYLNVKGKLLFGGKFKIYPEDREILFSLCSYFIKDKSTCEKLGIDIHKGILLTGPVGCGKTSLIRLLKHIVPHQRPYEVIPTRNIVFGFNSIGYNIIEDYGNRQFYCFDDLGVEPKGKYFGKNCNVLGEILLSRYNLFLANKIRTHATTSLNPTELEEYYGDRVYSRMKQLFNLICFDKKSKDKRNR